MAISMDRLYELAGLVTTLEPRPGRNFGADNTIYIAPEVVVKKVDDDYVVLVDDDRLPRIRISPYYRRLLAKGKASAEVRRYIKDKYKSAQWLMRNIEQRKSTIYKVTKCIMDLQRDFLERGPEYLKPLTLQQVADMVGMHESTISRVTSNKYVDTPRGVYELKYFFTSGIDTDGGDAQSSTSIRSQIEELIRDEDKKRPLSDQKMTDLLKSRGLNIARRTVTKYRESLGILSSKLRREY
jgi:RNA polymerase sigma-54 factor